MPNPREPFEPDTIYHVYNHGNGDELIFREAENYRFFLQRFMFYITPIAWIYAYCLMPNHFHFLIRTKSEKELIDYFLEMHPDKMKSESRKRSAMSQKDIADLGREPSELLPKLISNQFKNFLISYSKSFNKVYDRRGSLFLDNIKRISVNDDDYFTNMIRYIHFNPVLHGFSDSLLQWKFSSIHAFFSEKRSLLCRQDVLDWFGGKEEFEKFHQSVQEDEFDAIRYLTLE
jgi:putative transposase